MILRNFPWPSVFNSSGARGFFGEGYWFHHFWRPFGLSYAGSAFVAKTTTVDPKPGNMPLRINFRPKELVPSCIVVKMTKGVVLNSVGLSGPGASTLIDEWLAGHRPKFPWLISFMAVGKTTMDRHEETSRFLDMLKPFLYQMGTMNLGLQINFSCPNVGLVPSILIDEIGVTLNNTRNLGIPVLIKLNPLVGELTAKTILDHPGCDGLVMGNTIPWGKLPDLIDWEGLFGSQVSPLAHIGGGGLSGAPLNPIVCNWIQNARKVGITKPIVASGGILSKQDASNALDAGADAIELGSVSILRPWRVRGIIDYVNMRKPWGT